jgi:hypothetical protein
MDDPTLDHIAAIFRTTGRLAMGLAEVATTAVAISGAATHPGHGRWDLHGRLASRLDQDPRFLVLDTGAALPGVETWDPQVRAAYAVALGRLALAEPRIVVFREGSSAGPPLATLLRVSTLALLELRAAPAMALAAERTRAVLTRLTPLPLSGDPSTTPPPGPPPPRPGPPMPRRPGPGRPPTPGSRPAPRGRPE